MQIFADDAKGKVRGLYPKSRRVKESSSVEIFHWINETFDMMMDKSQGITLIIRVHPLVIKYITYKTKKSNIAMSSVTFLFLRVIHKTLPTVFKGTLALQYLQSDTRRSGY